MRWKGRKYPFILSDAKQGVEALPQWITMPQKSINTSPTHILRTQNQNAVSCREVTDVNVFKLWRDPVIMWTYNLLWSGHSNHLAAQMASEWIRYKSYDLELTLRRKEQSHHSYTTWPSRCLVRELDINHMTLNSPWREKNKVSWEELTTDNLDQITHHHLCPFQALPLPITYNCKNHHHHHHQIIHHHSIWVQDNETVQQYLHIT